MNSHVDHYPDENKGDRMSQLPQNNELIIFFVVLAVLLLIVIVLAAVSLHLPMRPDHFPVRRVDPLILDHKTNLASSI